MFIKLIPILIILFCFSRISFGQDLIRIAAAIQISSAVSDGKYTLPEIIAIAKKNKIKVLVIADRDLMRWEYGLWPLRNVIKKTVEKKSVIKYGIKRYLNDIENLQKNNFDILLIPAIESAPFYYWEGNVYDNSLKINNWHKHLLTVGLKNPKDYQCIPVIGNKRGLALPFGFKNVFLFWPILILLCGISLLRKPSRKSLVIAIFFISFGLLFTLNNYPFRFLKFDQYHGDSGIMPYQNYIDYVNKHGGLTFWAHPEAENIASSDKIRIETRKYTSDLLQADNYTGFMIFHEGYKEVGRVGGIWDEILSEYCRGIRKTPVWAIGGLAFDADGDLSKAMENLRTVFLVPALDKTEALNALREGRMYVLNGRNAWQFTLDKFILKDDDGTVKTMGQEMELAGKPRIEISGHFLNGQNQPIKIKLIKGGGVVKTFETASPFELVYIEEGKLENRKDYYRIEIESEGVFCVSNPIFVKPRVKQ
jgi:hypothetical protein